MASAFITGGSRGIGRAIVLEFAKQGLPCAFTYCSNEEEALRTEELARAANSSVLIKGYKLDLRDLDAIETVADKAVDDFGSFNVLVSNAGIVKNAAAAIMSNEDWSDVVSTNLTGPFVLMRSFLMHFLSEKKGGRIIALSSIVREGGSGQAAYAASKAGLVGLVKSLAREYGPKGISSNIVAPGYIETDMTEKSADKRLKDFWVQFCPLKRTGTVEDVANLVYFLASPEGSFINGQVINVSGGLDYVP